MDYNFISGVIRLYYDGRLVLKQEYYNRKGRSEIFEACIKIINTQSKNMEIIVVPDPEPKVKVTLDYDIKAYQNKKISERKALKRPPKIIKPVKPKRPRDPIFVEEIKTPIVRPLAIYSNRKYT